MSRTLPNLKKTSLSPFLILAQVLLVMSLSATPGWTEHRTADGVLTLEYPTGWQVLADEPGAFHLSVHDYNLYLAWDPDVRWEGAFKVDTGSFDDLVVLEEGVRQLLGDDLDEVVAVGRRRLGGEQSFFVEVMSEWNDAGTVREFYANVNCGGDWCGLVFTKFDGKRLTEAEWSLLDHFVSSVQVYTPPTPMPAATPTPPHAFPSATPTRIQPATSTRTRTPTVTATEPATQTSTLAATPTATVTPEAAWQEKELETGLIVPYKETWSHFDERSDGVAYLFGYGLMIGVLHEQDPSNEFRIENLTVEQVAAEIYGLGEDIEIAEIVSSGRQELGGKEVVQVETLASFDGVNRRIWIGFFECNNDTCIISLVRFTDEPFTAEEMQTVEDVLARIRPAWRRFLPLSDVHISLSLHRVGGSPTERYAGRVG